VTPLKDRIGSQILTHYPETVQIARTLPTEAKLDAIGDMVHVPSLAKVYWKISFEARESEFIDNKSGVSARMSITAYENLLAQQNVALLELVMIKQPYVCRLYGYHTLYYG
jgi:magnesium chelatase subunit I